MAKRRKRRLVTRRRVRRAIVCLILGSVMTIAVAWACAAWSPARRARGLYLTEQGEGVHHWGFGVTLDSEMWYEASDVKYRGTLTTGWPFPSLRATEWGLVVTETPWQMEQVDASIWRRGISLTRSQEPLSYDTKQRLLPLHPVLQGFVIDTLFYAGLLGAVRLAQTALLRAFRRRRGLCISCGYDLAGITAVVCPECGSPMERKA